jgi:hypothetical protein
MAPHNDRSRLNDTTIIQDADRLDDPFVRGNS